VVTPWRIGNVINRIAAFGAMPVRTDLPNALEHFEIDALFGQTSEERAGGLRCPAHGLDDLPPAGAVSRRSMPGPGLFPAPASSG
jgi:hypothetical protein